MVNSSNMSGIAARNSFFFTTAAGPYMQTPLLDCGRISTKAIAPWLIDGAD